MYQTYIGNKNMFLLEADLHKFFKCSDLLIHSQKVHDLHDTFIIKVNLYLLYRIFKAFFIISRIH